MTMMFWSATAAALMETLVMIGGVMWIMSGPGAIGVVGRVILVAMAAVTDGAAFAFAAARRST